MTWISYTDTQDQPALVCLGPGDRIDISQSNSNGWIISAGTILADGLTHDEAKNTMGALVNLLTHSTSGVVDMRAAIRRQPPIHDTTVDTIVDTINTPT